jgi:hypothetical protein
MCMRRSMGPHRFPPQRITPVMLIRFAPLPWEAELSQASQAEAVDGYNVEGVAATKESLCRRYEPPAGRGEGCRNARGARSERP